MNGLLCDLLTHLHSHGLTSASSNELTSMNIRLMRQLLLNYRIVPELSLLELNLIFTNFAR